jgi:hypothetical protein
MTYRAQLVTLCNHPGVGTLLPTPPVQALADCHSVPDRGF